MNVQPTALNIVSPVSHAGSNRQDSISIAVRAADDQQGPAGLTAVSPLDAVMPSKEISRQELERAAKTVEKFVEPMTSQLQFSVDEETGTRVVKVIDRSTKEVIRQIPSEEMLQIARSLERLQGLLFRDKA